MNPDSKILTKTRRIAASLPGGHISAKRGGKGPRSQYGNALDPVQGESEISGDGTGNRCENGRITRRGFMTMGTPKMTGSLMLNKLGTMEKRPTA